MNIFFKKNQSKAMQFHCMAFAILLTSFSSFAANESRSTWQRKLKTHSVGLGLGQVFLFGNHDKYGDSGLGIDLFYAYTVSYSFDLLINSHYSSHSSGATKTSLLGTTANIKGRFFDYDSFAPYFIGGLGFYHPKNRRLVGASLQNSSSKIGFGFSLGLGVDLKLNERITVGLMSTYHHPFDQNQDLGPDVTGSYMRVLMTAFYTF